jgi:hypothetical protein
MAGRLIRLGVRASSTISLHGLLAGLWYGSPATGRGALEPRDRTGLHHASIFRIGHINQKAGLVGMCGAQPFQSRAMGGARCAGFAEQSFPLGAVLGKKRLLPCDPRSGPPTAP